MNKCTLYRTALAMLASVALCAPVAANDAIEIKVLATLPVTYGLGSILLEGSGVELVRAAPDSLPASRQPSYFSGRGAKSLDAAAGEADAVITLRSLWAEDPLYPLARRSNIRIVEIDAARPVDGALPGIALQPEVTDQLASQPWLSINNLGRMADVMAADLSRLVPADQSQIDSNLATLKRRLLQLSAESESRLAQLDNITVVSLTTDAAYLLSGLNMDVVQVATPEDGSWTSEQLAELSAELSSYDVVGVVLDREPDVALGAAIAAGGSQVIILPETEGNPIEVLGAAIDQLINALAENTDAAGNR
ncbi:metal ABC transporter solute-binding protein, Zn/Mn family [Halopseudomonas pelagia]|uniref:metal ABC transporter solute-binding protein, Zn/Mn family n=1 Tax=Halopseudomonas pelagia TaxID=553151 RepID=UPI0003B3287F|nr:zinc ABC transporter substrate-binding protein [Halopseudomonas pelagia]